MFAKTKNWEFLIKCESRMTSLFDLSLKPASGKSTSNRLAQNCGQC